MRLPPRRLRPLLLALLLGCQAGEAELGRSPSRSLEEDVRALAGEAFKGREIGTPGEKAAADYISARFREAGLKPVIQEIPGHAGESGRNVLALVPGRREGAVVIGAHFDHLGEDAQGRIHYGADDNASGTAVLLALAPRLARKPPERTIVLAAFSGEEVGCFGSKAYVKHPLVPLEKTSAMINLDMVGRLRDTLVVFGSDSGDRFREFLTDSPIKISFNGDPLSASDNVSFYVRGVPAVHLFTGAHPDYHRPTDTADKLNYPGMEKVALLTETLARRIADAPEPLKYQKIAASSVDPGPPKEGARPYFGSMPDYAYKERGVRLDFVTPGSPADKAGLRAGDIVVGFGGADVTDTGSYDRAIRAHKPGEGVKVVYLRDGARLEAQAVLSVRKRSEE